MKDGGETADCRLRGFHSACGALLSIGFRDFDGARWRAAFFASPNSMRECATCPSCGEPLVSREILSPFEMDRLRAAARERTCSGLPLDPQTVAIMSSELEEGHEFEFVAALYGFTADALRTALAAFLPSETSASVAV